MGKRLAVCAGRSVQSIARLMELLNTLICKYLLCLEGVAIDMLTDSSDWPVWDVSLCLRKYVRVHTLHRHSSEPDML